MPPATNHLLDKKLSEAQAGASDERQKGHPAAVREAGNPEHPLLRRGENHRNDDPERTQDVHELIVAHVDAVAGLVWLLTFNLAS